MTEKIETVDSIQIIKPNKEQMQKINEMFNKKGENEKMSENEKLKEKLEEETSKREQFEATLKLIGEQKLEEKFRELNVPEEDRAYFRENPSALKGYELGKTGNHEKGGKGSIGMTAGMLAQEKNHSKTGYATYEELVKDVCEKAAQGDKEMQEVKDKLWEKMVQGWKENPVQTFNQTVEHPNMIKDALERANRKWRKERGSKE